jgi:hypothetical protein
MMELAKRDVSKTCIPVGTGETFLVFGKDSDV